MMHMLTTILCSAWVLICLFDTTPGNVVHMNIDELNTKESHHDGNHADTENPRASSGDSQFTFAKHFGDNMVLQRAPYKAVIHGFSPDIGQKVMLQMSTASKPYYYTTHVVQGVAGGEWSVTLDPQPVNTTVNFVAQSERGSLRLSNVIFGDVWICGGQSNMAFTVSMLRKADLDAEVADAVHYPDVRVMTVQLNYSDTPLPDLIGLMQPWTAASVPGALDGGVWKYFSAMCYLYGKALYNATRVPQGLISSNWGGTPVQAWSGPDALAKCGLKDTPLSSSGYSSKLNPVDTTNWASYPDKFSILWNAMIYPMVNMTIKGAIWYQGEADAIFGGAIMNRYNCTFPSMIADWRDKFSKSGGTDPVFPFGFMQLAPDSNSLTKIGGFPDIRWHQTADVGYVPNSLMPAVFMAVAIDLPDNNRTDPPPFSPIHPRDKPDMAHRLALAGLSVAYGNKSIVYQGPFPTSGQLNDTLNDTFVDIFYANSSIEVTGSQGFEVWCKETPDSAGRWFAANISSSDNHRVTIKNTCLKKPHAVGVRYLWRESPCDFKKCPIYEKVNSLPAPPFYFCIEKNVFTYCKFP